MKLEIVARDSIAIYEEIRVRKSTLAEIELEVNSE
jgi:hypothetical protein